MLFLFLQIFGPFFLLFDSCPCFVVGITFNLGFHVLSVILLSQFEVFLISLDTFLLFCLHGFIWMFIFMFLNLFMLQLLKRCECGFIFPFDFIKFNFFVYFRIVDETRKLWFCLFSPELNHLVECWKLLANFDGLDVTEHHFAFYELAHQELLHVFWFGVPDILVDLSCMNAPINVTC